MIIQRRMNGTTTKPDFKNERAKLTKSEEDAIVQYIFDLDLRGFSPTRANVEDIANLLLAKRGARRVGKCWTDRFIIRRPELYTRFSRVYDYQRALQEDPDTLNT